MQSTPTIHILGAVCGLGAENPGCSLGPIILQSSSLLQELPLNLHWQNMLYVHDSPPKLAAMPAIAEFCERLAEEAYALVANKNTMLAVGGDQSCSAGTWSGVAAALKKRGELGLIWIDAHLDSHTPEDTPSGNIHGMPLAALLGYGDPALTQLMHAQPKLKPEHVCIIGARSYEANELELLQKLGLRIFFMDEVKQIGFDKALAEAIKIVKKGTTAYGLSIDLDGIDPQAAPAVGCPEPDGIRSPDFLAALKQVNNDPQLIATEIVEFNPNLDKNQKTEKLISEILRTLYV